MEKVTRILSCEVNNQLPDEDKKLYFDINNSAPIAELLYEGFDFNVILNFKTKKVKETKHFSFDVVSPINLCDKPFLKYKVSGFIYISRDIKKLYYNIFDLQMNDNKPKSFLDKTTFECNDDIALNELIYIDRKANESCIELISLIYIKNNMKFNITADSDFYKLYKKGEIDLVDLYYLEMCEEVSESKQVF